MAKDFNPVFDRVLIKRNESSLQKKSNKAGLIVPENIQDKYKASEGVLVKCGDGCAPEIMALLNQQVLFARYSGDDIVVGGTEYVLATDKDIFGGIIND